MPLGRTDPPTPASCGSIGLAVPTFFFSGCSRLDETAGTGGYDIYIGAYFAAPVGSPMPCYPSAVGNINYFDLRAYDGTLDPEDMAIFDTGPTTDQDYHVWNSVITLGGDDAQYYNAPVSVWHYRTAIAMPAITETGGGVEPWVQVLWCYKVGEDLEDGGSSDCNCWRYQSGCATDLITGFCFNLVYPAGAGSPPEDEQEGLRWQAMQNYVNDRAREITP